MANPLRVGDLIRLVAPSYGQPSGDCVVIADQQPGGLVWFAAGAGGAAFVARRGAVQRVKRRSPTVGKGVTA